MTIENIHDQRMNNSFQIVKEQQPKFGIKVSLYTSQGIIEAHVTRNPFLEKDDNHYWMFKNIFTDFITIVLCENVAESPVISNIGSVSVPVGIPLSPVDP